MQEGILKMCWRRRVFSDVLVQDVILRCTSVEGYLRGVPVLEGI